MPEDSQTTESPRRQLGVEPPPAEHQPEPRRRRHLWVWIVVLGAFALLAWAVMRSGGETKAGGPAAGRRGAFGPVPVTTASATTGNLGVYLTAIGTVTPVHTVSITAQVNGVITAVHYKEGQFVKKGDPLIDIDARTYEAQLQQAEGTLLRDQHQLAEAQMDYERYKTAWSKNAIPRQTFEDQGKVVEQLQGTVKNDEGTVQLQKVQVGYTHITSPISGNVGLRLVDPGNVVTANSQTPLVVVTQSKPMTVIFTVSEDNLSDVLAQMRKGKKLPVEAWDRQMKNKIATGKLETVDNQIDTTTGTVRLRAVFDNNRSELFPNQFVNTRMLVNTLDNQVLLPTSAIQHNGDEAFVYLIENGQAKMTPVTTGVTDNGMTAVTGIKAGDVVADSSFEKLVDGSKIMVAKPGQGEPGQAGQGGQAGRGGHRGSGQRNASSESNSK
jgi:multidrug efflux system membrane fusion protein